MMSPVVPAGIRQGPSHHCLRCFVIALLTLAGCGGGSDKTTSIQPVASAFRENTRLNRVLAGDLNASVTDAPGQPYLKFRSCKPSQ